MSPDEALATVLKQNPRSAIVISENAAGDLRLTVGPDMPLEHINLLLDQTKSYLIWRAMNPAKVPAFDAPTARLATIDAELAAIEAKVAAGG